MAPTIIGANEATRVSRTKTWDRNRGYGYVEVWRGPIPAVETAFSDFVDDEDIDTINFDGEDGVGTFTKTIFDDDGEGGGLTTPALNSYWEVYANDIYKNIRAHQTFNADADQVGLEGVRKLVEQANGFDASLLAEPLKTYAKLLRLGVDEFVRSAMILRNVVPLGRRSDITGSWLGVDEAHQIGLPGGDPSPDPPSEIIGTIENHPEADADFRQWLKRGPQIRQVARGRYEINQDWWFARRWSKTLYDGDVENGNP